MYSAMLGMLWSVCTRTFIPFFSVRVATGNSWPRAGIVEKAQTHKSANTALRKHRIVFINPPSLALLIPLAIASLLPHREDAHWAARSAFQLDWRYCQKRSRFRHFAQVRKILQVIQSRS